MKIRLRLFGAFRDCEPGGEIEIEVAPGADVAGLRMAFDAHARAAWGARYPAGLLKVSAFASETDVLDEQQSLAGLHGLAVLPPVSGG